MTFFPFVLRSEYRKLETAAMERCERRWQRLLEVSEQRNAAIAERDALEEQNAILNAERDASEAAQGKLREELEVARAVNHLAHIENKSLSKEIALTKDHIEDLAASEKRALESQQEILKELEKERAVAKSACQKLESDRIGFNDLLKELEQAEAERDALKYQVPVSGKIISDLRAKEKELHERIAELEATRRTWQTKAELLAGCIYKARMAFEETEEGL